MRNTWKLSLIAAGIAGLLAGCSYDTGTADLDVDQASNSIIKGTIVPDAADINGVVHLTFDDGSECSGTLLTNGWVLTAGHCLGYPWVANWVIVENSWDRLVVNGLAYGESMFLHPKFAMHSDTADYDFALIRLSRPLDVAGSTTSVYNKVIARAGGAVAGKSVTIDGYGQSSVTDPNSSGTLRTATFTASDNGAYLRVAKNSSGQIPWLADSGGPMWYFEGARRQIAGVGSTCVDDASACDYTKADLARDFIDQTMFRNNPDWTSLGGNSAGSPASVVTGPGKVSVFIRDASDGSFYFRSHDNGWTDWQPAGGYFLNGPAAASRAAGKMAVFGRGGDEALWVRRFQDGVPVDDWCSLGGRIIARPAAVSYIANQLWVFAIGGDNQVWYRKQAWDGGCSDGSWEGWGHIPGGPYTDPAAASIASGRVHVVVKASDGSFHVNYFNGSWNGWGGIGGSFKYSPAAVSSGPGILDIFGVNQNNQVVHTYWWGAWATTWSNLGGYVTAGPAADTGGLGNINVWVRGGDNGTWHRPHPW